MAFEIPVTGKFFEDLSVGDVFTSKRRTVTETDLVTFSNFSWDHHPAHTDAEYAATTNEGARILHGPAGFAICSGLEVSIGFKQGTSLVMMGMNWAYKAPIFIGDTLYVREEVVAMRVSKSRPEMGIVTTKVQLLNQKDEVTQEGEWVVSFRRREGERD
jgi:acyl dehydratase